MEFIDLKREFREEPWDTSFNNVEHSGLSGINRSGRHLDWTELLKSHCVVLLAEAGSGKTTEMQERVRILNQEGRSAFYLPLEALDRESIRSILSPDSETEFENWRANSEETAWFFLDAVDELKLASGKLDRALNRLRKDLDSSLDRIRVTISSRPSDWRFITDRRVVEKTVTDNPRKVVMYCLSRLTKRLSSPLKAYSGTGVANSARPERPVVMTGCEL